MNIDEARKCVSNDEYEGAYSTMLRVAPDKARILQRIKFQLDEVNWILKQSKVNREENKMNISELKELLTEIARTDLDESAELQDHPCSVAVRALDKCFDDIHYLKRLQRGAANDKSKRAKHLLGMNYNPDF